MTTYEYLNQVNRLEKKIRNNISNASRIRELIMGVSSLRFDNDRVQNSRTVDITGDKVARLVDLENKTNELVDKLIDARELIVSQIDNMDNDNEYDVLHLRFITCLSVQKTADTIGYSVSQTKRLLKKGMEKFERKYGYLYKDKR